MKNLLLTILAIVGLVLVLYFPIVGIVTLCENDEEISDLVPLVLVENEEESVLDDFSDLKEEDTQIENIEDSIGDADIDAKNVSDVVDIEKSKQELNILDEDTIIETDVALNENVTIVNGFSVKDSFDWHKARILSGELTFIVIDRYDNVNYYLDYEQLQLEVLDDINYKKEYELNPRGELIKYIYTEVK